MGYPYVCGFCNHDDMVSLYLNTALIGIPRQIVYRFAGDASTDTNLEQGVHFFRRRQNAVSFPLKIWYIMRGENLGGNVQ